MNWLSKKLAGGGESSEKGSRPPCCPKCPVHTLRVVNACDILETIPTDNPAHEYLASVVDTYLDWSQTGSLQKLAGVDVILVKADVILDKIKFRVSTEMNRKIKRGEHVPYTLETYLTGFDYLNIYKPTKSQLE